MHLSSSQNLKRYSSDLCSSYLHQESRLNGRHSLQTLQFCIMPRQTRFSGRSGQVVVLSDFRSEWPIATLPPGCSPFARANLAPVPRHRVGWEQAPQLRRAQGWVRTRVGTYQGLIRAGAESWLGEPHAVLSLTPQLLDSTAQALQHAVWVCLLRKRN